MQKNSSYPIDSVFVEQQDADIVLISAPDEEQELKTIFSTIEQYGLEHESDILRIQRIFGHENHQQTSALNSRLSHKKEFSKSHTFIKTRRPTVKEKSEMFKEFVQNEYKQDFMKTGIQFLKKSGLDKQRKSMDFYRDFPVNKQNIKKSSQINLLNMNYGQQNLTLNPHGQPISQYTQNNYALAQSLNKSQNSFRQEQIIKDQVIKTIIGHKDLTETFLGPSEKVKQYRQRLKQLTDKRKNQKQTFFCNPLQTFNARNNFENSQSSAETLNQLQFPPQFQQDRSIEFASQDENNSVFFGSLRAASQVSQQAARFIPSQNQNWQSSGKEQIYKNQQLLLKVAKQHYRPERMSRSIHLNEQMNEFKNLNYDSPSQTHFREKNSFTRHSKGNSQEFQSSYNTNTNLMRYSNSQTPNTAHAQQQLIPRHHLIVMPYSKKLKKENSKDPVNIERPNSLYSLSKFEPQSKGNDFAQRVSKHTSPLESLTKEKLHKDRGTKRTFNQRSSVGDSNLMVSTNRFRSTHQLEEVDSSLHQTIDLGVKDVGDFDSEHRMQGLDSQSLIRSQVPSQENSIMRLALNSRESESILQGLDLQNFQILSSEQNLKRLKPNWQVREIVGMKMNLGTKDEYRKQGFQTSSKIYKGLGKLRMDNTSKRISPLDNTMQVDYQQGFDLSLMGTKENITQVNFNSHQEKNDNNNSVGKKGSNQFASQLVKDNQEEKLPNMQSLVVEMNIEEQKLRQSDQNQDSLLQSAQATLMDYHTSNINTKGKLHRDSQNSELTKINYLNQTRSSHQNEKVLVSQILEQSNSILNYKGENWNSKEKAVESLFNSQCNSQEQSVANTMELIEDPKLVVDKNEYQLIDKLVHQNDTLNSIVLTDEDETSIKESKLNIDHQVLKNPQISRVEQVRVSSTDIEKGSTPLNIKKALIADQQNSKINQESSNRQLREQSKNRQSSSQKALISKELSHTRVQSLSKINENLTNPDLFDTLPNFSDAHEKKQVEDILKPFKSVMLEEIQGPKVTAKLSKKSKHNKSISMIEKRKALINIPKVSACPLPQFENKSKMMLAMEQDFNNQDPDFTNLSSIVKQAHYMEQKRDIFLTKNASIIQDQINQNYRHNGVQIAENKRQSDLRINHDSTLKNSEATSKDNYTIMGGSRRLSPEQIKLMKHLPAGQLGPNQSRQAFNVEPYSDYMQKNAKSINFNPSGVSSNRSYSNKAGSNRHIKRSLQPIKGSTTHYSMGQTNSKLASQNQFSLPQLPQGTSLPGGKSQMTFKMNKKLGQNNQNSSVMTNGKDLSTDSRAKKQRYHNHSMDLTPMPGEFILRSESKQFSVQKNSMTGSETRQTRKFHVIPQQINSSDYAENTASVAKIVIKSQRDDGEISSQQQLFTTGFDDQNFQNSRMMNMHTTIDNPIREPSNTELTDFANLVESGQQEVQLNLQANNSLNQDLQYEYSSTPYVNYTINEETLHSKQTSLRDKEKYIFQPKVESLFKNDKQSVVIKKKTIHQHKDNDEEQKAENKMNSSKVSFEALSKLVAIPNELKEYQTQQDKFVKPKNKKINFAQQSNRLEKQFLINRKVHGQNQFGPQKEMPILIHSFVNPQETQKSKQEVVNQQINYDYLPEFAEMTGHDNFGEKKFESTQNFHSPEKQKVSEITSLYEIASDHTNNVVTVLNHSQANYLLMTNSEEAVETLIKSCNGVRANQAFQTGDKTMTQWNVMPDTQVLSARHQDQEYSDSQNNRFVPQSDSSSK